jgi:hypothetical protein
LAKYLTLLERLARDNSTSLFDLLIGDEEKKFYKISTRPSQRKRSIWEKLITR